MTPVPRLDRVVPLAALLSFLCAGPATASSLALTDVQFSFDSIALTASLSAGLVAHGDPPGADVFLDAITVSLAQDGTTLDLTAGPTFLDDSPFFLNTPPVMADGETLSPVTLFNLSGLVPGSFYSGSFSLIEGFNVLATQEFSFEMPQQPVPPTPVPEPSTLLLVISGACAVARARRGRRAPDNRPESSVLAASTKGEAFAEKLLHRH